MSDAKKVHGDRYDYSRSVYVGANKNISIICPEHGEFWQKAANHLLGYGCPQCAAKARSSDTDAFVAKCEAVYGKGRYDYSRVNYVHSKEKVCIICPEHGEFWMSPNNHMRGHGCPSCYGTPKKTREQFIQQAIAVHGDMYDYSKVEYDGTDKKVCIVCPVHGEFWQTPYSHLNGTKCPACSHVKRIDEDGFKQRSAEIHKNKFDYSKVHFVSPYEKVCIVCPEHGEFWQKPSIHLRGYGCPVCGGSQRLTTEEFIEKANRVHNNRYLYDKTEYINTGTKVCITCPIHGDFWQTPNNHLFGAGCPVCNQSHLENIVMRMLKAQGLRYDFQKTFDWLCYRDKMYLDFFLPEHGVAIECQGGQHFYSSELFGGEDNFADTLARDQAKKDLCEKHGIKMLYFSNLGIDYPYPVIENLEVLLKEITNKGEVDSSRWKDPELPFSY